ncbi:hypothetical protein QFC22_004124 [Naganishia vaughanmartiniae]|uniref:Uncharacterized protein n=1 Tax=Naganishia vaughanmartiniae TaxID=1424756 RepID=A0ACC2X3D1_9TREE|nr:hypothetical protein QFC22_004124 [Naganishia vaughanmartiniae]
MSGKGGAKHSSLLKAVSALTRMGSVKTQGQKHDDRCQLAGLILAQGLHRQIPGSLLCIKSPIDATSPDKRLAERYCFSGGSVSCRKNAVVAAEAGRSSISQIWKAMTTCLEASKPSITISVVDYASSAPKPRPFRHKVRLVRDKVSEGILDLPDPAFIRSL